MIWDQNISKQDGFGATPIVFILLPLTLLGGFLLFSSSRNIETPKNKLLRVPQEPHQETVAVDSDQDKLKDWEEHIYTTDPQNPDSDEDGTSDGDEINQGRDPLKKGPNDMLTQKNDPSAAPAHLTQIQESNLNLTQQLTEVFTTDYLMDLVRNPESKPDVNKMVDKMAHIALANHPSHTPLTANDIIISHDTTKKNITDYLTQLSAVELEAFKPLEDKKAISEIITDIVHTDNDVLWSAANQQLEEQIKAYNRFLINVKNISVPRDFASLHISYINTATEQLNVLTKIQGIKNDPMAALVGLQGFSETTKTLHDLLSQYIKLALESSTSPTLQ